MSWSDKVYAYCERGSDPSFWAEPLNALTNAAFLVAAGAAAIRLAGRRSQDAAETVGGTGRRLVLGLLIALVAAIGIGSFVFHTFATRWALLADVGPITLFMLTYLAFALRVFLGLGWLLVALGLPLFLYVGSLTGGLQCGGAPCFNGSLGYAPALLSLVGVGLAARSLGIPAGTLLLKAAGVFFVSAVCRTIDFVACSELAFIGYAPGTHLFWHLLNALTLYILLVAAIDHRPRPPAPASGQGAPARRPEAAA